MALSLYCHRDYSTRSAAATLLTCCMVPQSRLKPSTLIPCASSPRGVRCCGPHLGLEVVLCVVVHMRGVEQSLGWDAAHIETGAPQGSALLDASDLQSRCETSRRSDPHLHSELSGLDRRDVPSRATTKDDNVSLLSRSRHVANLRRNGPDRPRD